MHRTPALAAGLVLLAAPALAAAPDGDFAPLDAPSRKVDVVVTRPRDPNGPGTLSCFYYPTVTVKQLLFNERGAQAISVTPVQPGRPLPPCGKQDDPGEIVLKRRDTDTVVGAIGGFLHTATDDGLNGFGFRIYDALTGRPLYTDGAAAGSFSRASVQEGVLSFTYPRIVYARCSILSGGGACWSRLAQEARLPPALAAQPPPVASCRENYRKGAGGLPGPTPPDDPSYIVYDVTMTLDRAGKATVLSRGVATCWPTS